MREYTLPSESEDGLELTLSMGRTTEATSWNSQILEMQKQRPGASLVTQRIRLCAPNAGGLGLIPGQGPRSHMHAATKRSHATTKLLVSCN